MNYYKDDAGNIFRAVGDKFLCVGPCCRGCKNLLEASAEYMRMVVPLSDAEFMEARLTGEIYE